jgi:hypothetical protein
MKHMVIDDAGIPLAFYSEDIHDVIPPDAVEITEAQWREFIDHSGRRRWEHGKVVVHTPPAPAPRPATKAEVDAESDRRIEGGFWFEGGCFGEGEGYRFDSDKAKALPRITGAGTLAGFALGAGAQPGDFHWHGGANPFTWIVQSNEVVPVDAPTMFAIARRAADWESAHVIAARTLKDMHPIPRNFADDSFWP